MRNASGTASPSRNHRFWLPGYLWIILLCLVIALIIIIPHAAHGTNDNVLLSRAELYRAMWFMPDFVAWLCGIVGIMFIAYGMMRSRALDDNPASLLVRESHRLMIAGVALLAFFVIAMIILHTTALLDPNWRVPQTMLSTPRYAVPPLTVP